MNLRGIRTSRRRAAATAPLDPVLAAAPLEARPLAAIVASAFARAGLALRIDVLRRLLAAVGPLALAVVGGGAFAKYLREPRWPALAVSLEDAARATSSQVFELVRYVEQSNPDVVAQALAALARDATVMGALGASVAALVIERLSVRSTVARDPR
ncbi:MAG: hypothetical protein ABI886_12850 [Betaproteobacteria bacterium]